MTKEDLLQDWLPRLWDALRDVRQNNNAAAEETMYELYVEMKQQTLAEKLETFGEITLEDQLSALAIELLAAQKREADLELQICQRHFEANHIPDDTKMVSGVKDSLTTQQEQGEPVAWTLLLVGEHNGIVGKAGYTFENHPEHYRRVDVYTTPQQPKQMTDEDFLDWYDSAIWGNEDFKDSCWMAFEAGWKAAHGIKENT